ncbi:T-cell immunoreceptor with Ig and ITIM domains isoform X1 [Lepisosteus oculatus]|uniref:T-cell immunoreceptor with Ig and ITIM domains isoform X1 n=1 Tax=Lepisosteus oculatus TaxID=7918 RepID=UPI0037134CE5
MSAEAPPRWHPASLLLQACFVLLSGALVEGDLMAANLTAAVGGPATLSCPLARQETKILQAEWNRCNAEKILTFHQEFGVHTWEAYKGRISAADNTSFTLGEVTRNDSGEYCCILTTFPDGKLEGRTILQLGDRLKATDAPSPALLKTPYIAVPVLGGLVLFGVIALVIYLQRQNRPIRNPVHVAVHTGSSPIVQQSFIGKGPQTAPSLPSKASDEPEEEEDTSEDYFNVLTARPASGGHP